MRQHGLCLVVGRVRHCHARHPAALYRVHKECVAQTPGDFFQVSALFTRLPRDVLCAGNALEAACGGQLADEFFIAIRLSAAQLVVEMQNGQKQDERLAQLFEQQKERHRIGSAGDGDADAVSRVHHAVLLDERLNAFCEPGTHRFFWNLLRAMVTAAAELV